MYKTVQKVNAGISNLFKFIVVIIFAFPFLWMLSVSLQTSKETNTVPITLIPKIPQIHNFVDAWTSGPFATYLSNSIIVIISIIAIQILILVPAAYAFAKCDFKGKGILFGLVLVAFMTPTQVTFLPIYNMMSSAKLMNTLFPQILPFITNAFGIFLLRQYFMQIPDELIEAAKLDNASTLQVVFKLMLPMSKPAITTIVLLAFVGHWNEYFWPLIITNSTSVRPLTIGIAMLKDTEGFINWNTIMAGNMILVGPIILFYLFCSKSIIKSFAYSGIK